jgi:hypothetical protein
MTRPHLIVKLILAAAGIRLLLHALGGISSVYLNFIQNVPPDTVLFSIMLLVMQTFILFVISGIFLFKSDYLISLISGHQANQCEMVNNLWIIAGFRMTFCFCGILMLYQRIKFLFYYGSFIKSSIQAYLALQGQSILSPKVLSGISSEIVSWIILVYLILGAPHYINWQIKILSQIKNIYGSQTQYE